MSNWYTKNLSERVDMRLLGLKTTVLGDKTRIQEGLDRLEQCAKKRKETCGAGVLHSQNFTKILKKLS